MTIINNIAPSNIPTKPNTNKNIFSFPNDLQANGRDFAMAISFSDYTSSTVTGAATEFNTIKTIPAGSVLLPLPKRINDVQTISWEEFSATSAAGQIGGQLAEAAGAISKVASNFLTSTVLSSIGSAAGSALPIAEHYAGAVINPMLWMLFKQPNFREFTFQWTLAPNNAQESLTLMNMINFFKKSALHTLSTNQFIMNYPRTANIYMLPSSQFMFEFKPCVVTSVQVDYTAGGQPSFFKGTNAPTIIGLTLSVKEMELWTSADF